MKKKLIGTLLAATLIISQAAGIFAAGSKTSAPDITENSKGKYEITISVKKDDLKNDKKENLNTEEKKQLVEELVKHEEEQDKQIFDKVQEKSQKVYEEIININKLLNQLNLSKEYELDAEADNAKENGKDKDKTNSKDMTPGQEKLKLEVLVDAAETMTDEQKKEVKKQLKDKELLTKFFDLIPIDGGIKDDDGNYVVTMELPVLTEALEDQGVAILHFSIERELWEIIHPENIDFEEKEITAKFQDLSPVAFIVDTEEAAKAALAEKAEAGENVDLESVNDDEETAETPEV